MILGEYIIKNVTRSGGGKNVLPEEETLKPALERCRGRRSVRRGWGPVA